ncbi:transcription repressor OFP13-like [Lolium rigidum]|uniref:transcription repressor OFP13-like n=1 Tax=Lolium rigidum TaxID=89674 RepID=UPI001F5C4B9B|nr:transcription repressor OFP13-like [Lolium rigidum]
MGRKSFSSIFSKPPASADESSPPWPWPSCRNPHTSSFRDEDRHRPCVTAAVGRNPAAAERLIRGGAGEMYKTVNSVYQLDYLSADGSCFGDEEEHGVLELELDDDDDGFSTTTASEEWSEAVIRSLGRTSTDRFFVDPGPASNSIMALSPGKSLAAAATSEETAAPSEPSSLVEESVAVAVDSEDPYGDFRASMEEMVAAHGLRGWDALEELLVWYLRINGKHNHALIVGAFVDLLVGLAGPPQQPSSSGAAPTATTTATTMTSATSRIGGSTTSTSTSSSTCACGGDTTPTTATAEEQCGGRSDDASRSPASSDDHGLLDKEVEEDLVGDKAGDDRSISSTR